MAEVSGNLTNESDGVLVSFFLLYCVLGAIKKEKKKKTIIKKPYKNNLTFICCAIPVLCFFL